MSWVDLAALTVMLWSAVKGCLLGIRQMVVQLCGLIVALLTALFLQKPFSLYLNLEWQADAFFCHAGFPFYERTAKCGRNRLFRIPLATIGRLCDAATSGRAWNASSF